MPWMASKMGFSHNLLGTRAIQKWGGVGSVIGMAIWGSSIGTALTCNCPNLGYDSDILLILKENRIL